MIPDPGSGSVLRARAVRSVWPAGTEIARAHSHAFGSVQLDARSDVDRRFSPLRLGGGGGGGVGAEGPIVPVLYGGKDERAAASETIFHTVDAPTGARRPRQVLLAKFLSWQWTRIAPTRDLVLVDLRDDGLAALGLDRIQLIDGGRASHGQTRRWAAALLRACHQTDGLVWSSRQDPARQAMMLVGRVQGRSGGVAAGELVPVGPAQPFALPAGLELLDSIADTLDIAVLRS